jgi:hypothetical protein
VVATEGDGAVGGDPALDLDGGRVGLDRQWLQRLGVAKLADTAAAWRGLASPVVAQKRSREACGHCCIRAEGVTDEYQSGGWFHSEGDENGSRGRS